MTSVSVTEITMPTARIGADNPLPKFWWQQPGRLMDEAPVGLSDAEMEGYISQGRAPILPYQVQDKYSRDQKEQAHRAIVMDNGALRVTVLPDLGGRLYSMVDLSNGRELLFRNPVFQPANLSLRNAWFSGGIEWNGGAAPGHTASTCETIFTRLVETGQGPILRLHEFDRVSETAWQIDLFLPENEARCFVHGRIINSNPDPRPVYWWTNATAPYEKGMRIVSPAAYSIEHILPDNHLERCEFPEGWGFDASYPGHWRASTSIFFRDPPQKTPWIAACMPNGQGLGQISTASLTGRKYFFFGNGEGGRHWAEYLSERGKGQYVEIQSGILPTQNQLMTLQGGQSYEWTECFVPLNACAEATQGAYADAVALVGKEITQAVPESVLAQTDAFLSEAATLAPTQTFSTGQPWAALHEEMTGRAIAQGLDFSGSDPSPFWKALATGGQIPASDMPDGFVASTLWLERLEKALAAQPRHAGLHLLKGIALLDREEFARAATHLEQADQIAPGWMAARCLAVLHERQSQTEQAKAQYQRARAAAECPPDVVLEYGEFLKRAGLQADLVQLLGEVPEQKGEHERLRILRAEAALADGDYTELGRLLDYRFATVREGEVLLSDLWKAFVLGRATTSQGRALSDAEAEGILAAHPVPFELNFVMKSAILQADEETIND